MRRHSHSHSVNPLRSSLLGGISHRRSGAFGPDSWARLDQVQELGWAPEREGGHTGCVNALSWSDDGSILLSGSDDRRYVCYSIEADRRICIWTADTRTPPVAIQTSARSPQNDEDEYPVNALGYPLSPSPHPLRLKETIDTGHTQNIFSARFLPHANTPTIVSCAGDRDIRVFEVERLAMSGSVGERSLLRGVDGPGVRVLRCHTGRTKRIATEESPHLFLTVSEDGTVRQHDLRRPHHCRSECPEVLFRAPQNVGLYSLSMSPTTPHTFAVAGQTDAAYICDRRFPDRQSSEWGNSTIQRGQVRCVRRLGLPESEWEKAGNGRYSSERHITCVKISPDHPDEVICSFASHSTSLFSLNDTPVDRGVAAGSQSGLLPENHRSRGASLTTKRRMSDRASNPASPSHRRTTRPRRGDAEAAADDDDRRELQFEPDESRGSSQFGDSGEEIDLESLLRRAEMEEGVTRDRMPEFSDSDSEEDIRDYIRRTRAEHSSEPDQAEDDDDDEEMEFDFEIADDDEDEDEDDFDDDDDDDMWGMVFRGASSDEGVFKDVDMIFPRKMFFGAKNADTVKDCNFLGTGSDKVCSGSDDGNFFVWDKVSGRLEGIWEGDGDVVNVVEQHPTLPLVAVSGIDNTVKMFAPLSSPPPVSMSRTANAEQIIRRNQRARHHYFEPSVDSHAFQILSHILTRRRQANPGLSDREHLLALNGRDDETGQAPGYEPECRTQ